MSFDDWSTKQVYLQRFDFIFLKFDFILSLYYWIDERGKKVKYSAPQYIELTMTFIQKNLSNENIFPTRLGKNYFIIK
jgi:hypothetical protein